MTPPDNLCRVVSSALRAAERDVTNIALSPRARDKARRLVHRLDELLEEMRQADEAVAFDDAEARAAHQAHQHAMGRPGARTTMLPADAGAGVGR